MMSCFDYETVFETAKRFAKEYSEEITIQDQAHESAWLNGREYPCVPLKFAAKGNRALCEKLLASGCVTKMDGSTENGKRICRVLLWIEPNCSEVHVLKEICQ